MDHPPQRVRIFHGSKFSCMLVTLVGSSTTQSGFLNGANMVGDERGSNGAVVVGGLEPPTPPVADPPGGHVGEHGGGLGWTRWCTIPMAGT